MSKRTNLDNFSGFDIKIQYEKVVKEYAEKAKNTLRSVSPKSGRPNRSTPYWTGWTLSQKSLRSGLRETVWNETNWQLTHLLENGHWISNSAHPNISWSPPQKHIKPTYERIKPQYVEAMKDVKIDANLK